jgi:phage terminase large subunit-like protein
VAKRKPLDPGDRAVRFINALTHTKGKFARQPFNLRPWQVDIVRRLFGTIRPDGLRQFRTALLMLPRKNGKSELAAAIALYGLLGDGEIGAEVYSAAADRDQASLVFNVAAEMVRNDPELNAICEIVDSQKRIVHRKSGSVYRAISAEAYSKHGFNASLVVYDELHAAPNRDLWDVLSTSQGARSQPLMLAISTAGYDRHSVLYELYAYACQVRDGIIEDPTFLAVLYEAQKADDWLDETVWMKSNPALGDFRNLEEMQVAAKRAKEIPAQENAFRRLYLNQWTEQAERWIPMDLWDQCRVELDRTSLRGRRCYIGMDLSSTTDLTALVAVFPREDGFDILPQFFVPRDNMERRANRDRVPYLQWMHDGHLVATSGNTVDYDFVRKTIRDWSEEFSIRQIGYDRWNATDIVMRLKDVDRFDCVPIAQKGKAANSSTKAITRAVESRRLRHDGHPILRWNMANAAVEVDAEGDIFLSKKVATERIDGAAALRMAVECMEREPDPMSAYEDRGVLVI